MTPNSQFALTPIGLRHKALVNSVAGGTRVVRKDGLWERQTQEGHLLARVHRVDLAAFVAPQAAETEWLSRADWEIVAGDVIESFDTTWQVPPPPTSQDEQTLFLFNSLMPADSAHILQPVLQWGPSASPGGGKHWCIASWWVGGPNDPLFITELIPVNPGDVLMGRMALAFADEGLYEYSCEFVGVPATRLVAGNLPALTICSEVLEVGQVQWANDYPPIRATSMTRINIATQNNARVTWTSGGRSPPTIVLDSGANGQVDIIYPT